MGQVYVEHVHTVQNASAIHFGAGSVEDMGQSLFDTLDASNGERAPGFLKHPVAFPDDYDLTPHNWRVDSRFHASLRPGDPNPDQVEYEFSTFAVTTAGKIYVGLHSTGTGDPTKGLGLLFVGTRAWMFQFSGFLEPGDKIVVTYYSNELPGPRRFFRFLGSRRKRYSRR